MGGDENNLVSSPIYRKKTKTQRQQLEPNIPKCVIIFSIEAQFFSIITAISIKDNHSKTNLFAN